MNAEGNNGNSGKDAELDDDEGAIDDEIVDTEATIILTEIDDDDDLSETVVGLDVDEIVAKIEGTDAEELAKKRAAKKRLDALQEQLDKDDKFGSTYAFDVDKDLPT